MSTCVYAGSAHFYLPAKLTLIHSLSPSLNSPTHTHFMVFGDVEGGGDVVLQVTRERDLASNQTEHRARETRLHPIRTWSSNTQEQRGML